ANDATDLRTDWGDPWRGRGLANVSRFVPYVARRRSDTTGLRGRNVANCLSTWRISRPDRTTLGVCRYSPWASVLRDRWRSGSVRSIQLLHRHNSWHVVGERKLPAAVSSFWPAASAHLESKMDCGVI